MPLVLFFLKIALTIWNLLCFHLNFRFKAKLILMLINEGKMIKYHPDDHTEIQD